MCVFSRYCIVTSDISGINQAKMSMPAARAEELKILLHGLLISSPRGITVDHFERDFLLQEGHGAPFHELGYPSFMKYLESIPDTFVVSFVFLS
jgi:hypothetical protein